MLLKKSNFTISEESGFRFFLAKKLFDMKKIFILLFLIKYSILYGINVAIPSEPQNLKDPIELIDTVSFNVAHYIHEPLFNSNSESDFYSNILKKWTVSLSKKKYCFYLKNSVYFHNNKKMSSDDVIFSINKCLHKASCTLSNLLKDTTIQKNGEQSFCILLKKTNSIFLYSLSDKKLSIIPKYEHSEIIGIGPYRFIKKVNNKIFLQKFNKYSGKIPINDSITFHIYKSKHKFIEDNNYIDFQEINQMIPVLSDLEMRDIKKKFEQKTFPLLNTNVIFMNNDNKIFKNLFVRKFLFCIFRQNNFYEDISNIPSIKATGFISRGMIGHLNNQEICSREELKNYYLKIEKNINLTLVTYLDKSRGSLLQKKVDTIFKKFNKIKIKVIVYKKQFFYTIAKKRKYEMILINWIADFTHPLFYIETFQSKNEYNIGNIKNKKIDSMIQEYTEKRKEDLIFFSNSFDKYLMDNAFLIPLSYNKGIYYYKKNVTNIEFSVLGPYAFDLSNIKIKN